MIEDMAMKDDIRLILQLIENNGHDLDPDTISSLTKYIERHLFEYPNTETMTPVSCKKCGRLLEYISTLNENTWTPGYLQKKKTKK